MKIEDHITRPMLTAVWAIALLGFAAWFALAWGGHHLLDGGTDWLAVRVETLIANVVWELRFERVLAWIESFGSIALWAVWALGSAGLLLTVAFATALYLRARRAFGAAV
jgi:hypothetical protein